MDRIYVDSRPQPQLDGAMGLTTRRATVVLRGLWGFRSRLAGEVQAPLMWMHNAAKGNPVSATLRGLSDVSLLLHVSVLRPLHRGPDDAGRETFAVHLNVGARLPTGSIEGVDSRGVRLEEESLQLGAGAPAALAGARFSGVLHRRLSLSGAVSVRAHPTANRHRYRYGTGVEAWTVADVPLGRRLGAGLTAAFLHTTPDRRDDDLAESTGRSDLSAGPTVWFSPAGDVSLRGTVLRELTTRARGLQLVSPWSFSLYVRRSI